MCVLIFGIRRIKRRKTPYVFRQTMTLTLFQWIPLFILPFFVFPWMGANEMFSNGGFWGWFGQSFLSNGPESNPDQYYRAFGFILAWPLFVANWFSGDPLWGWLILGFIQTFVIIPWIVLRWGKGCLLRLDLLMRSSCRNNGRRPAPQDASRTEGQSLQYDWTSVPLVCRYPDGSCVSSAGSFREMTTPSRRRLSICLLEGL